MSEAITPASFNQAYRAYAVEQGSDAGQATQKAADTADSNSATAAEQSAVVDEEVAVTISPEAARLYAESVKRRTTVVAADQQVPVEDTDSAMAGEAVQHQGEETGQAGKTDVDAAGLRRRRRPSQG